MPNASEVLKQVAEENELLHNLRLAEKAEKEGKTLKDFVEILEARLDSRKT